jgi:hypothetical protein
MFKKPKRFFEELINSSGKGRRGMNADHGLTTTASLSIFAPKPLYTEFS